MVSTPAAFSKANGVKFRVSNEAIVTVSGSVDRSLDRTNGNRNCPHAKRNVMIVVEAIPGTANGSAMRRSTWRRFAPSQRAASSSAAGKLLK